MMCSCEPPEVWNGAKERVARKAHRCCECRRVIAVGERYEFCSGIWDSEPNSYKTCAQCALLRTGAQRFVVDAWDCGPCFMELFEWLSDRDVPVPMYRSEPRP